MPLFTRRTQKVVHGRESTVWSHHRQYDAGWQRGRPFLRNNSVPQTMTRRNPWRVLPRMARWQYVLPLSVPRESLASLITLAQVLLGRRKTYSKKAAFETGGNSHAREWWQSRSKTCSVPQFLLQIPHQHLRARRFRFVRILQRTAVAHQEEEKNGRSIVSRPGSDAIHRWICAQTFLRVPLETGSRTICHVISHLACHC